MNEREDEVKMKMKFKRILSGVMAVATLASVIVQPMTVSASEKEPDVTPFEQQYPKLKEVQDSLDADEIITANDIELSYGEEFEAEVDLSGIEGVDESKLKVLFHEAKNKDGTDFDTHTPDTYKAVYAVEPISGHPSYRISRNITVKEPETETHSADKEKNVTESEFGELEDESEDSDLDRENDSLTFDKLIETAKEQDTYDEESGLQLHDVMEQAGEQGIDIESMTEGEVVAFTANARVAAAGTQNVTIEKGTLYYYSDYDLGSYVTEPYYITYGSVRATAYCVQPAKPGPGSGTYNITKIADNQALAKVCYYGKDAAGSEIQISNISQIRVSKEPPRSYPIGSIIGLCICILGIFVFAAAIPVWIIGIGVFGIKLGIVAYYNSNLQTYLIIEMNSGRTSLFSAREESFLIRAKDSLIESFNQKNAKILVDFSKCVIKDCVFGDNGTVINTGVK